MAAKKRYKKHKLKEDQLVTSAVRASQYVQEHFTQVISGIVILVAAIGVILFTAQARRSTAKSVEQDMAAAMNAFQSGDYDLAITAFTGLSDRHSGREPGKLAMYFLGEANLAKFRFEAAVQAYDRYLASTDETAEYRVAATIGKALSHEGQSDYRNAAEILEQLSQGMDTEDPRYLDVLFQGALFFQEAGISDRALALFQKVSETATGGVLKESADVWISILD